MNAGGRRQATEVKEKLAVASDTRASINEKRELFRSVATRGSVLYFAIVEIAAVNVMYQSSLDQFLQIFLSAIDVAGASPAAARGRGARVTVAPERTPIVLTRAANIVTTLSTMVRNHLAPRTPSRAPPVVR